MTSLLSMCSLLLQHSASAQRSPLFPYTTLFRSHRASARSGLAPRPLRVEEGRGTRRNSRRLPLRISARSSAFLDRKSTRLNSSHRTISYAVFCPQKKHFRILALLIRLPRAGLPV